VGSKVTALSNRYGGLERRDLRLNELRFQIYFTENRFLELLLKFEGDPTVGSKVTALSNRYGGLER